MATSQFREQLSRAVAATSGERAILRCRAEGDAWRYRPGDPLRPLFSLPTWGVQEDANWRWHHQSLAQVGLYAALYLETRDPRALAFLPHIVDSWCAEADDPQFTWGEHTTPLRLERILRMFGALFDELDTGFRGRLVETVRAHVDRLSNDLVVTHHNHALDQIYALILAKRYLPFLSVDEANLASRLAVERAHLLSVEGVVTENSPGYQSWIPSRIAECQRLLTGESDATLLEMDREFTAWSARPDGTWPQVGDTLPGKRIDPPPGARSGLRVFPHAGYAVYRDARTWFMAKCGFLANAHRHHDDGGFLLVVDGEDVFIEAGMFGYAKGWEREYARSPEAHNTSYRVGANIIKSTTSRRWQRQRSRWGMSETEDGVLCRSYMFDDAVYTRRFRFSADAILVEDSFDKPGPIRTRFHAPAAQPVTVGEGCVGIGRAMLRHDLPPPLLVPGHVTTGYLEFAPAQVIEFEWPRERRRALFTIETRSGAGVQP